MLAAQPTGPTTARATVTPSASGSSWMTYNLIFCPVNNADSCVYMNCAASAHNCNISGLWPSTSYLAIVSVGGHNLMKA